jgi:sigma-B regulation protein RsbU (phosphoserine phosphatase)
MAGVAGGLLFLFKKGRHVRIFEAVLLMVGMEISHILVALVISGTGDEVMAIVRAATVPMIVANGAGMAVFIFMIDNLARERRNEAIKYRIESELHIAREIQMSMVPAPPPGDAGYSIHALLQPAREVGGDLYNFFPIGKDRLCVAIGDVAGKGVPASLYMAITQKLIKAAMREGEGPAMLLARLNREICDGNDTITFVTLFVGFYDNRTGEVIFSNAGHNPPYLVGQDGASRLAVDPAMALGVEEDVHYGDQSLQLEKGDTLFLYTDGVTEAMDTQGNQYSDDRLERTLARLRALDPESMCQGILGDLGMFVGSNEQSDDITMLALTFHGPAEE